MFARLQRIVGSLALVLGAFLAYRATVVPLVEPSFDVRDMPGPTDTDRKLADEQEQRKLHALQSYFPAGSWELENPIVLENDRSWLLFKEYQNLDGGRVQLNPCSILFLPDGDIASGDASRRVIVLRSPQGALLQFDQAVDLQHAKIGKLLGGQMDGQITVHGTPSHPGANDELDVVTRDLRLTTDTITTVQPVQFRFGPNEGRGREMRILLAPSGRPAGAQGMNVGGVQAIELLYEVQMRLVPGNGGLLPMDADHHRDARPNKPPAGPAAPPAPLDIRCAGPFHFDLVRNVATFEEHVQVRRDNPTGPPDQMSCPDRLSVYFAPKAGPSVRPETAKPNTASGTPISAGNSPPSSTPSDPSAPPKSSSLEPRRIEARGSPVIVDAPSSGVFMRGQHLDYDIALEKLKADDPQEVTLRQTPNEIHARSVAYQAPQTGRLGWLEAEGPGWLRGVPPPSAEQGADAARGPGQGAAGGPADVSGPRDPRQPPSAPQLFEAHWTGQLKMRPHDASHVISLTGDARAGFTGQGELSADEIHVWVKEIPMQDSPPSALRNPDLREPSAHEPVPRDQVAHEPGTSVPGSPPRTQVIAERLLAQGHVHIKSPQLTGATDRLEAWFEQAPPEPGATAGLSSSVAGTPGDPAHQPGNAAPSSAAGSSRVPAGPPLAQRNAGAQPMRRYGVDGQRIRVQLLTGGPAMQVQNLTVEGQVRFAELPGASPDDQSLVVTGDQLEVLRADAPDTAVNVSGKPGQIGARGLDMFGDVVRLNKGTNRLWIDGPGRMKLTGAAAQPDPAHPKASEPQPSRPDQLALTGAPGEPITVTWDGRMNFDGFTAQFERNVVAQTETRTLRTDTMNVTLRQRIDFAQPKPDDRPEVGKIFCPGDVRLDGRTFDPQGLASIDRMQFRELMVDQTSGAILGRGPGWLTSVRRGSADPSATQATTPVAGSTPARAVQPVALVQPPPRRGGLNGQSNRAADDNRLNYLNVQFQGPLSGNLNQHEVTFHDQVRCVYGPVLRWDDQLNPDSTDALGPQDMLLNCDELTVRQAAGPPSATPSDHRPMEMEAIGNALAEGQVFTARAHKLTYTELKDLLVLEGDGRGDAQLFRQEKPGAPQSKAIARKILYWRSTNRAVMNDAQFIDLDQPSGGKDGSATDTKSKPSKPHSQ